MSLELDADLARLGSMKPPERFAYWCRKVLKDNPRAAAQYRDAGHTLSRFRHDLEQQTLNKDPIVARCSREDRDRVLATLAPRFPD